jgi:MFS family permease
MLGAGLLTGCLFALLTGLSQMGSSGNSESGFTRTSSALLLATGVVLMFVSMLHIRRARDPIIEWQVLRGRPFLAANIFNFIFGACYFGILSFVPLYAVSIYGMSTLESGLVLAPWSVGVMIAAGITSFFLIRWGYRKPMVSGTAIMLASLSLLAVEFKGINLLGVQLGSTALMAGITFLLGIGTGIVLPAANNACIELMPNRVASISGVRAMFRNIGGTLSIAITALLLNNIGNMGFGFTIVFFGLAAVMFIASPLIFRMPKAPKEPTLLKNVSD